MVYTVKVAKDLNGTLITIGDVDPNDPNGNKNNGISINSDSIGNNP